jgi:hypothetical protein
LNKKCMTFITGEEKKIYMRIFLIVNFRQHIFSKEVFCSSKKNVTVINKFA